MRCAAWSLVLVAIVVCVGASKSYDALVDEMINLAKLAAQAHNTGNAAEAAAYSEKVKQRYTQAVGIDKAHPQAYLTYATFLSNSNKFVEAIELFKMAASLVGGDSRARAQVMAQQRRAEYGLYSSNRDKAYKEGAGDVFEAVEWGEKQLSVSPDPSKTQHDVATLYAMLCEYDAKACETATQKFRIASHSAFQQYTQLRSHEHFSKDPTLQMKCTHSQVYVGSWAMHRHVETHKLIPAAFVDTTTVAPTWGHVYFHTVLAPVRIVGRDGIVRLEEPGECTVLSTSSDHYLNLADNLKMAVNPNAVTHTTPVITLVQFAASSYYHWIAEVVPRLVLTLEQLSGGSRGVKRRFIVPKLSPKAKFIVASIELIFGAGTEEFELVEYVPGMQVTKELSFVTWDRQPCPPSVTGGRLLTPNDPRECPALAHPYALFKAREALRGAINRGPWSVVKNAPGTRLVIFAQRGNDVTMRRADEASMIERIRAMLKSEAAVVGPTELHIFDAATKSLEESLALFKRASVVVGVHGGALANIIVCPPDATVVEVGFQSDAATHYQHLALSLGMTYRRIRALPDAQGRSMGAPDVRVSIDAVVDAVRHSLGDWSSDRAPSSVSSAVVHPTPYPWSTRPSIPSAHEPDEL